MWSDAAASRDGILAVLANNGSPHGECGFNEGNLPRCRLFVFTEPSTLIE